MQDIVKEALQNANDSESHTSVDDPNVGEFGAPICAVIGCGPAGLNRVELVKDADATAVIGTTTPLEKENLESVVTDAVGDPDILVVTGHIDTTETIQFCDTVCRQFSADTTVIVILSIPREGLPAEGKTAFLDLTGVAGMMIPYDLSVANDWNLRETTAGTDTLEITNNLVGEMINDVFDTFRGSMAAPVLRWNAAHDLFNNGGVTLAYWGWAQRENNPEAVIEHVASNRGCDGDSQTATGGFGFVRFGESFTLTEFETLRETAMKLISPSHVEDDRWVFCGDSTLHQNNEYRLQCLLADVATESLGFM